MKYFRHILAPFLGAGAIAGGCALLAGIFYIAGSAFFAFKDLVDNNDNIYSVWEPSFVDKVAFGCFMSLLICMAVFVCWKVGNAVINEIVGFKNEEKE